MRKIVTNNTNTIIITDTAVNVFDKNDPTITINNMRGETGRAPQTIRREAKYEPYSYLFNQYTYSFGARKNTLQERLQAYIQRQNLDVGTFCAVLKLRAEALGVHVPASQTIRAYLRGSCCPKIDNLTALAMCMGVSVQWLTGYAAEADMPNGPVEAFTRTAKAHKEAVATARRASVAKAYKARMANVNARRVAKSGK